MAASMPYPGNWANEFVLGSVLFVRRAPEERNSLRINSVVIEAFAQKFDENRVCAVCVRLNDECGSR